MLVPSGKPYHREKTEKRRNLKLSSEIPLILVSSHSLSNWSKWASGFSIGSPWNLWFWTMEIKPVLISKLLLLTRGAKIPFLWEWVFGASPAPITLGWGTCFAMSEGVSGTGCAGMVVADAGVAWRVCWLMRCMWSSNWIRFWLPWERVCIQRVVTRSSTRVVRSSGGRVLQYLMQNRQNFKTKSVPRSRK